MYAVIVKNEDGDFLEAGLAVGRTPFLARKAAWALFLSYAETYFSRKQVEKVCEKEPVDLWNDGASFEGIDIHILAVSELRGGTCALQKVISIPGGRPYIPAERRKRRSSARKTTEPVGDAWDALMNEADTSDENGVRRRLDEEPEEDDDEEDSEEEQDCLAAMEQRRQKGRLSEDE